MCLFFFWPGSCTEGSSGYFGELPPKSMHTYLHQHLLAERNLFSQKKMDNYRLICKHIIYKTCYIMVPAFCAGHMFMTCKVLWISGFPFSLNLFPFLVLFFYVPFLFFFSMSLTPIDLYLL